MNKIEIRKRFPGMLMALWADALKDESVRKSVYGSHGREGDLELGSNGRDCLNEAVNLLFREYRNKFSERYLRNKIELVIMKCHEIDRKKFCKKAKETSLSLFSELDALKLSPMKIRIPILNFKMDFEQIDIANTTLRSFTTQEWDMFDFSFSGSPSSRIIDFLKNAKVEVYAEIDVCSIPDDEDKIITDSRKELELTLNILRLFTFTGGNIYFLDPPSFGFFYQEKDWYTLLIVEKKFEDKIELQSLSSVHPKVTFNLTKSLLEFVSLLRGSNGTCPSSCSKDD